jgi:hypothetical protein
MRAGLDAHPTTCTNGRFHQTQVYAFFLVGVDVRTCGVERGRICNQMVVVVRNSEGKQVGLARVSLDLG